ncbi:MAG: hypothetical protein A3H27_17745 [Acidobacteria bacterium RIFCSPLOWO2_02_FULL_59_13]|nr:MAG: hypothetical protein A3H27_17745 [Acidobacteria bacterium RIFCSPLOWO2_02_FULL_59_13]
MVENILLGKTVEVAIQKAFEFGGKGIRFLWKRHDDRIQRNYAAEVNRTFCARIILVALCALFVGMVVLISKESS